jgi:cell division septation protein DedD
MHVQVTVSDPNTSEITSKELDETEIREQGHHSVIINDVSPPVVQGVDVATKETSDIATRGTPVSDVQSREGKVSQIKKAQTTTAKSSTLTHSLPTPRTYSIQLGYFTVEPNADALLQKAKASGFSTAFTQKETRSGLTYFRVLVGKYSTLTDAQALLEQIHAAGLKGAVYRK